MSRLTVAHALLTRAVAEGVTPGAQLAVRFPDGAIEHLCVGTLAYEHGAAVVTPDTLYDLASLTKPVTALAFVRMGVALNLPIEEVLPWTRGTAVSGASLEQLLSHRAGLLPWAPYYQSVEPERAGSPAARRLVLEAAAREPRAEPGLVRYSDLGYMLLGEALTALTGTTLDAVVHREVVGPLGLGMGYRGIGATWASDTVAPTERCPWRGRVVQGEVHDENAYALGGVCGHAGLFGTARDVLGLGAAALDSLAGDARWCPPERMAWMIAPRPGGVHRLGWDARGTQSPSSGSLMGPRTFGHLGFTGTSLWCDPDARMAIALLTNRVHPSRSNVGIRALRPAIHDAVMAAR
jgi:CubicO group peptidase (beta-lactamase class C family)